jgi:uncharacterized RDD family membrane protein YckC
LQCGAILPFGIRACNFCDSSFSSDDSFHEDFSASPHTDKCASPPNHTEIDAADGPPIVAETDQASAWRGEVSLRMEAYRRKRRRPSNSSQTQLPFEHSATPTSANTITLDEAPSPNADDFSFTIAIGRKAQGREKSDGRMEIDVSVPPPCLAVGPEGSHHEVDMEAGGLYPVAALEERRFAAAIDAACLLFAYGAFLALFGSLGGQFTLSKLSAAVYGVTLAIVYLQYFALFTVFGGTTPGMMFRGLQVASFTGDAPTPRQMLVRSAGYILSAGTFFLGFFWAWWDEDTLTWHDRLSHTYLRVMETHEDLEASALASSHSR